MRRPIQHHRAEHEKAAGLSADLKDVAIIGVGEIRNHKVNFQVDYILGIECGATENASSVKRLLTRLRDHGLPTDRKYLFVISRGFDFALSGNRSR
jgi:hypothetical protein